MRRFSLRLLATSLLITPVAFAGLSQAAFAEEPMLNQPMPAPPGESSPPVIENLPKPTPAPQTAIERIPAKDAIKAPAKAKSVDELVAELKRTRNPDTARQVASTLMNHWATSTSPTVNLLMQWSAKAAGEKRNAAALDFLDQAIVLKPDFAGAWNQRATLHFTMGNYRRSISDIERVLQLEPRHFGAIAGLAGILGERGSKEAALSAWQRYLDIYPADREAQSRVSTLAEEIAGQRT